MFKSKKLTTKDKVGLGILVICGSVAVAIFLLTGSNFAILNPKGTIASEQKDLIIFATILSLVIILPVFALTAFIVYKYREGNGNAKYQPNWDHNLALESAWWGVPMVIITILSVVTWNSTHQLDPFKPLSNERPLTIQAVALQWKWLFIYPELNIASVNYLQLPVDKPVKFEITADAPMNSLWIPQLSGQMYAMSGMSTGLNIQATQQGTYDGLSANLSGQGFADMRFKVQVSDVESFDRWVEAVQQSNEQLNSQTYRNLAVAKTHKDIMLYGSSVPGLYNKIISKYVDPNYMQPTIDDYSYTHSHGAH